MNPEATCQDCGGLNPVWFAPNQLWNLVMGGPGATDDPGGMVCPNCFIRRAEAAGVRPTAWVLSEEKTVVTHQFRENGSHYNGGRDWFGYGYTAIGEPRLRMIRRWYRRGKDKGRTEDRYFVDGAQVETYVAAVEVLKAPPAFLPEEEALLAQAPAEFERRPEDADLQLVFALRDKGAVEMRPHEWRRRP